MMRARASVWVFKSVDIALPTLNVSIEGRSNICTETVDADAMTHTLSAHLIDLVFSSEAETRHIE